jgi:hypothetical protein
MGPIMGPRMAQNMPIRGPKWTQHGPSKGPLAAAAIFIRFKIIEGKKD